MKYCSIFYVKNTGEIGLSYLFLEPNPNAEYISSAQHQLRSRNTLCNRKLDDSTSRQLADQ